MIDGGLLGHLDARGVPFCLIGAAALAAHGFARFTADVDLLTLSPDILRPAFWEGHVGEGVEIRRGDEDDPIGGVVRIRGEIVHDVILGKGYAARYAVETARPHSRIPCKVATPLALVLLKLEAGGAKDRLDILGLVSAQAELGGVAWIHEVPEHLPRLSSGARTAWQTLENDLEGRS
ncbi:MAG: hypothetical protein U0P81_05665 [Holophagaceae bacterium]